MSLTQVMKVIDRTEQSGTEHNVIKFYVINLIYEIRNR